MQHEKIEDRNTLQEKKKLEIAPSEKKRNSKIEQGHISTQINNTADDNNNNNNSSSSK